MEIGTGIVVVLILIALVLTAWLVNIKFNEPVEPLGTSRSTNTWTETTTSYDPLPPVSTDTPMPPVKPPKPSVRLVDQHGNPIQPSTFKTEKKTK